jgi:hypothetical protein
MVPPTVPLLQYVSANRHAILVLSILSLVSYGFLAFNLTLAGDDWYLVRNPSLELDTYIPVGRWMRPLVLIAFFGGRFAPTFTLFGWLAAMMAGAILLAWVAGTRKPIEFFLFSALLLFSPVHAELVNFKHSHLMIGFGFLCAATSVFALHGVATERAPFRPKAFLRMGLAGLLMLLALGIQQSFILFAFMFFIASTIAILADGDGASGAARRAFTIYATVCLLAVAAYFAVTRFLQAYFDFPQFERGYALESSIVRDAEQLASTANRFREHLLVFLFREQHLWPAIAKVLFLALLGVYLLVLARKAFSSRRQGGRRALSTAMGLTALLAGLMATPWLLGLVRLPFSYRYNGLIGLTPLYPIVVTQTLSWLTSRALRYAVIGCALVIVTTFSYFQNVASLAVYTTNRRDHFTAGRILTRIEGHEGYRALSEQPVVEVVLVGRFPQEREPPFNDFLPRVDMGDSIVNCGVFNCQTTRIAELMAFVEYPTERRSYRAWSADILAPLAEPEKAELLDRLLSSRPWPDYQSIQILRNRVFVILSKPTMAELLEEELRI